MLLAQVGHQPLFPCPFCGNDEPEMVQTGTSRRSCIVACGNCGARHESGDSGVSSGTSWNQRTAAQRTIEACEIAHELMMGLAYEGDSTVIPRFAERISALRSRPV